ncbi:MAG: replication initiator [Nocardioidaceae bacterium]
MDCPTVIGHLLGRRTLDHIGGDPEATPAHVVRFGPQVDIQGVLAGTKDSERCIGYLAKYLTKQAGDCHQAETPEQADHVDRLMTTLRFEPCSPTCMNWLRFGVQPKNATAGMRPGGVREDPRRPPQGASRLGARHRRPHPRRPPGVSVHVVADPQR